MKKALLVARWEFLATVTRRAYIFSVVAMPVFFIGLTAMVGITGRSAMATVGRRPAAVVDLAGVLDLPFAAQQAARRADLRRGLPEAPLLAEADLRSFADVDAAVAALRAGTVSAIYVLDADYLQSGRLTAYGREGGLFSDPAMRQRQTQVTDAIRASLLKRALSGPEFDRAYAPAIDVKQLRVDADGRVTEPADTFGLGPFLGSFGVFMLLTMAIFTSAGFLQQATTEDRQNRMMEILLSSVDPNQLLLGKVLGLGGAGLLQVGIYLLLVIVPGSALLSVFTVPLDRLALSVVYFAIGYALFAALMAGTGMLGRTPQESAQLSAIWTLTAAAPMFLMPALAAAPNGWLARGLSVFPLTSPVTMMLRLSSTNVPVLDIVVSIAIGLASIWAALRGAARVFRAASLMYGNRVTLPELVRWLRAA